MPPEPPLSDDLSRFRALREDSLTLLAAARSLIGEMRGALDDCRRHRPAVGPQPPADEEPPAPAVRSHRGGRVAKKKRAKAMRRPR